MYETILIVFLNVYNIIQPDCEIQAVVLENTFTSILDMALILMPFLWMLQPFIRPPLLRNEWASHDHIHRIRCPILFVSGAKVSLLYFLNICF